MKSKNFLKVMALAITLFVFPKENSGQAPDLGTAWDFALFTAVGAFTNNSVGATYVQGYIGTDAGEFSGFPPGIVDGQIHVTDIVSLQAAKDVEIAYNQLLAVPYDSIIGTTLGNNQVLTAKVYSLGAASSLNGDLILDGQGNPYALFIFQVDGALTTNSLSNIILTNSAYMCNVYWQINGAVVLGDNSVFRGTIVANGAISLLESSSLFGRGLSIAGAITLQNNVVDVTTTTLPVELLSFIAFQECGNIQLDWSTASESNSEFFTLEKSNDATHFEIVEVLSGAGNSNEMQQYSTKDYDPFQGVSYYRLKQTDFDGKFTYSKVIEIDFESPFVLTVYPNPFSTSTTIVINDDAQISNCEMRIFNEMGETVICTTLTKKITIMETKNLDAGIYFYIVIDGGKIIQSGKLISLCNQ